MLSDVAMNPLEAGLLDNHLKNFNNIQQNVTVLLTKLLAKNQGPNPDKRTRAQKAIEKTLALFEKHEFWSTQPVQNVYDLVEANDFNRPVEQKEISEI